MLAVTELIRHPALADSGQVRLLVYRHLGYRGPNQHRVPLLAFLCKCRQFRLYGHEKRVAEFGGWLLTVFHNMDQSRTFGAIVLREPPVEGFRVKSITS